LSTKGRILMEKGSERAGAAPFDSMGGQDMAVQPVHRKRKESKREGSDPESRRGDRATINQATT